MPSAPDPDPGTKSPYAGLDYEYGVIPSTAAIGPLAQSLAALVGVSGMAALSAAILLDQGKSTDALDLLDLEIKRLAAERDAKDAKAERRRAS